AAGVIASSLALLSDAGHMLADAGAIGFSLVALRLASRPAGGAMTFGFRRVEILSAQANGVTLLVLAAFITYEAIHRLFDPLHVRGWLMLGVGLAGIVVNLAVALVAQHGVVEVHDLHVCEVTSGFPAFSAHVLVAAGRDCHEARREMEAMLHERFGLDHTTLQVDHIGSDLLEIAPPAATSKPR